MTKIWLRGEISALSVEGLGIDADLWIHTRSYSQTLYESIPINVCIF